MEVADSTDEKKKKYAGRLLGPHGGPLQEHQLSGSQRDYCPTPFTESSYELIGETVEKRDFLPMELDIIQTHVGSVDPMFEEFDGDRPRDSKKLWHLPEEFVFTGEHKVEEVIDYDALMQANGAERFEAGRQEGYKEGYKTAEEQISLRYQTLSDRLTEITERISAAAEERFGKMEREAVKLSLDISQKILLTTVQIKPDYILDVIRQGLKTIGAAKPVKIRVSEEDYEFLQVIGMPAELSPQELGVEYVLDENVKSGCVIETDFGEADLQVEKMWAQLKTILEGVYK